MPNLTIILSERVFDLRVNPNLNGLTERVYLQMSLPERQQAHETDLQAEIVEKLERVFQIKAVATVSANITSTGVKVVIDDLNVPSDLLDKVLNEVKMSIAFHRGFRALISSIEITAHGAFTK